MASSSLLVLIDDIATLLDDVAIMSKAAAKQTAGVLGDDLALNAQQVTGVKAERELPVVWAVAKGSFLNKLILVPAALAISAFVPWLITPLLMIGGLYLCFEGFEKIIHPLLHKQEDKQHHEELLTAVNDPSVDIIDFEKNKIKGAIRTDFILSAEIIAITLGVVEKAPFATQAGVLTAIAIGITVFVYGLVAGIVRLDDWGLFLSQKSSWIQRKLGMGIIILAPYLMKTLSIVGTAAMFIVGGGIIVHGIGLLHHALEAITHKAAAVADIGGFLSAIAPTAFNTVVGLVAGALVFLCVSAIQKIRGKTKH